MSEIFNVLTDVDAGDCTRGLYGHRKRGHWKLTLEKNPLPHRGLEPASVLRLAFQSDALPAELFPPLGLASTVKALIRLDGTGAGDVGSIPRFGCPFSSKDVVYGHCLVSDFAPHTLRSITMAPVAAHLNA